MIASGNGLPIAQRYSNSSSTQATPSARRVLPDVFVILAPAFAGLVQAADEGGCGAVRQSDYAGLAMKEGRIGAGHDADLDVALLQNFIKAFVARAPQETLDGIVDLVPALLEELLAGLLGGVDVLRVQIGVADDPHLADGVDLLVDEVEDRGAKIAGDAEVFRGALKAVLQVDMGQALAARGEPVEPSTAENSVTLSRPARRVTCRSPEAFVADQAMEDAAARDSSSSIAWRASSRRSPRAPSDLFADVEVVGNEVARDAKARRPPRSPSEPHRCA